MFTHLKNIDTAFKHIRQFSIFLIVANLLAMCFWIYRCTEAVNLAQSRVHILYNGKLLDAIAADRKTNLPVELRDHIRTFHQYFFDLSPDDKAIDANVAKALYLADESAKREYDNLKESGYYNNLISANGYASSSTPYSGIRAESDFGNTIENNKVTAVGLMATIGT